MRVAHMREQEHRREKEITITDIVREERKIIEDRYHQELDRLRSETQVLVSREQRDLIAVKNKNEKISRQVLDKEQKILDLHAESAAQHAEIKSLLETLELTQTKLRALEHFSSDLQSRFDKLAKQYSEKDNAMRQLMANEIA